MKKVSGGHYTLSMTANRFWANYMQLPKLSSLRKNPIIKTAEPYFKNRFVVFILLTLPIILYGTALLMTKNKNAPGDSDYIIQTYEAMRMSILKYHQFPWWNPWVSGGVPLFANPQFGLFSIQAVLALLFGAIFGTKLTIVTYFILGFWGFKKLFVKVLRTPVITAILLSYIWTFGSFLTQRASGGHYTFLLINLFPWALLFYLGRKASRWSWLWLGVTLAIMANAAAHYMTILSYLILALLYAYESIRFSIAKHYQSFTMQANVYKADLLFWIKAGGIFILLSAYRLYFTFSYLKDYPRLETASERTIGPIKGLFAMFGPFRQFTHTPSSYPWGWLEASAYIGLCTGVALLLILFMLYRQRHTNNKLFTYSPFVLLALIVTFFILGLGNFAGPLSPYLLLRHLPIFSSMRVATRWFAWCSFFVLIFIAAYQGSKFRKVINILLFISVIELFVFNMTYLSKPYIIEDHQFRPSNAAFEQKRLFNTKRFGIPYDENFTEATDNNIGQIIAGDSLIDTRWEPPFGLHTNRCSIDEGCEFVMTKNATVDSWSPNKIVLTRTADGPISLNMNPGNGWLVNGKYAFLGLKATDPAKAFTINDTSQKITVEYRPRLSVDWLLHKI